MYVIGHSLLQSLRQSVSAQRLELRQALLRRSIVLKIRRERSCELRRVLKILGRQRLKLIGLHKANKQLVGKRAHLLHLLGREFQAIEDT